MRILVTGTAGFIGFHLAQISKDLDISTKTLKRWVKQLEAM